MNLFFFLKLFRREAFVCYYVSFHSIPFVSVVLSRTYSCVINVIAVARWRFSSSSSNLNFWDIFVSHKTPAIIFGSFISFHFTWFSTAVLILLNEDFLWSWVVFYLGVVQVYKKISIFLVKTHLKRKNVFNELLKLVCWDERYDVF